MAPTSTPQTPFGRVLTAMVTPFTADGALDLDGAQRLATHLVDAGNDGLIIKGVNADYLSFYLGLAIILAMAANTYVGRVRTKGVAHGG